MNRILMFIFLPMFIGCKGDPEIKKETTVNTEREAPQKNPIEKPLKLNLEEANRLLELPISCLQVEYPNKLGQTIGGKEDIGTPKELHPAFYGCFDWHSSVHGYWSVVKLLKKFPALDKAALAKTILLQHITKDNIAGEVDYFNKKYNTSYERTYGWAWLLKLAEEIHTWEDPIAKELEENLQPLTNTIIQRYIEFLPRLNYPIRVGEHTNTAFGLSFAWDYANTMEHEKLKIAIEKRARDFYINDQGCPINWEPSGYDFLSPCLEEVDLMRRVLSKEEFITWVSDFLPELQTKYFTIAAGEVSDRSDGKLVHLDGLNFSRAWVLYGLANQYKEFEHLFYVGNAHVNYSLPNLVRDSYEGGHWLGSFAIYALDSTSD